MAKKVISISIDESLCDKLNSLAGQETAKTSKRVSTSKIIETAIESYLKGKIGNFERKPLEGVNTKAITSKPIKRARTSKGYHNFEAIYDGKGKDAKSNKIVLFKSIQSSKPGLKFEASSKHKETGKEIKEFLATNPKQGDKISFEAYIEDGIIAQPRKIQII